MNKEERGKEMRFEPSGQAYEACGKCMGSQSKSNRKLVESF